MTTEDVRNLAIVVSLLIAPLALVMIFVVLKGYTIDLHMSRDLHKKHRRGRNE